MRRVFTQSLGWRIIIGMGYLSLIWLAFLTLLVVARTPDRPLEGLVGAAVLVSLSFVIVYVTCISHPTVRASDTGISNLLNFTNIAIRHLAWGDIREARIVVFPVSGSSGVEINYYLVGARGKVRFNDEIKDINELIAIIGDRMPRRTPVTLIDSYAAGKPRVSQLERFRRITRAGLRI